MIDIAEMNVKNLALAIVLPLIVVVPIGYLILIPPSPFNFIPFALYESICSGTGIEEHSFIIAFDLLVLKFLFLLFSRMILNSLKNTRP
ncbi:hypothetical protein [Adhaeribacter rhizoryzae]|uniref:Uncharacterized protein n=1 Tax=Adhaeribacter rhizoryzae TaxID=2607907 RepID=A0A5M6D751_9BACT|nr:hypothetical protein [Adhaeribacter rhizoryzae]KAA5543327.1 hypothetical protein F0145_16915 [Adhaeribacter rhizoryzae]